MHVGSYLAGSGAAQDSHMTIGAVGTPTGAPTPGPVSSDAVSVVSSSVHGDMAAKTLIKEFGMAAATSSNPAAYQDPNTSNVDEDDEEL